jgi:hypothetical protein
MSMTDHTTAMTGHTQALTDSHAAMDAQMMKVFDLLTQLWTEFQTLQQHHGTMATHVANAHSTAGEAHNAAQNAAAPQ